MLERNVGTTDKIVRLVIGAVIIVFGVYFKSWWGLLAILPIGTALVGRCGPYYLLGINTYKVKSAKSAGEVPPKL